MKGIKKISLLLVVILLFASLVACTKSEDGQVVDEGSKVIEQGEENKANGNGDNNYPLEVEDAFGNLVTLEKAPERIISFAPSHTEILFALGLGDKVVGVTSYCDYPEEALEIERVGDYEGVNYERVIELEPDLIVNYGELDADSAKIYEEAGIPVVSYMPESIDEVIETIEEIALVTGAVEAGEELVNQMTQKRDEIVERVKDKEPVKVFYEVWHEPLMTAGAGSFVDDLIQLANGINIARDAEGLYPNYDLEQLIENDPEVYISSVDLPEKTVEAIASRPGYEEITAIKEGRVYLLDGNIMSRPGPRIVDALEIMAKAIHPEAFE